MTRKDLIDDFDFRPGRMLAKKYEVLERLGHGWEGEVYLVKEVLTGIERAAKFFYPQRNKGNKSLKLYAQKLHKLRHCPILIQYFTQDTIVFRGAEVSFLVSDYVEGELLSSFLNRQKAKRLEPFQAVHLLHALAIGIESIHQMQEYHGDLHTENIIVSRFGLGFELKLIDLYQWHGTKRANIQDEVCDMVRIFYDVLGGKKYYPRLPDEVKSICCGLKRSLILKKFKTAGQLREYLEMMEWQ